MTKREYKYLIKSKIPICYICNINVEKEFECDICGKLVCTDGNCNVHFTYHNQYQRHTCKNCYE